MSTNFASYFVLGFFLFLGGTIIFALKKYRLLHLALKTIFSSFSTALVVLVTALPFFLITLSLLINDSFILAKKEYLNTKVGINDGIIYPRIQDTLWDNEKVTTIQSLVRDDFDSSLPILYKVLSVQGENSGVTRDRSLFISFNTNTALSYDPDLLKYNINFSLLEDEVIVSRSLANDLKIVEGDKITANSTVFKVREIVDDNGIIGFNLPLNSKYTIPEGSIFLNISSLNKLLKAPEGSYNGLLVARSAIYNKDLLQNGIQSKLYSIDKNLLFDEIKESTFIGLDDGAKVNFGQTLLLISILPLIAGIALIVMIWQLISHRQRKMYSSLRLSGFNKGDLNAFIFFQNIFLITIAGITGTLLGIAAYPFLVSVIKNFLFSGYNKYYFPEYFTPRIDTQSIVFAFTGTWIILSLLNLLWSTQKSQTDIALVLKRRIPIKIQIWSTKILLRISGGIVFVCGLLYFILKNRYSNSIVRTSAVVVCTAIIIWILAYGFQFKFRKQTVFSITAISTMLLLFLLKHLLPTKIILGHAFFSILEVIIYLIGIIVIIILNIPSVSLFVFRKLSFMPKLKKKLVLGAVLSSQNFVYSFATIFITILVLLLVSLGSLLNTYLNSLSRDNYIKGFEGTIVDNTGTVNVKDILRDGGIKFSTIESISYGTANLVGYTYGSLEQFDDENSTHNKDEVYQAQISVLSGNVLEKQGYRAEMPDIVKTFSESGEYIILGKNFLDESSKDNVRPNIKIGDTIALELPGKYKIERKVAGITEFINTTGDFDPTLFLNNGILLSEADYKILQEKESLYFATVYGFNFLDQSQKDSTEAKIHNLLLPTGITNITYKEHEIQKSINIRILITRFINAYAVLGCLLLIILQGIVLSYELHNKHSSQGIFYKTSYGTGVVMNVFLGSVMAFISLLYIHRFFKEYELNWRELFLVALALICASYFIIRIVLHLIQRKNYSYETKK